MDYEEKYKDALNKVKSRMENSVGGCLYECDIKEIFPELAESEDEKIKEGLIKYLKTDMECNPSQCESFYNKSIAWLEKQGEEKPADKIEPKFRIGDVIEVKPMKCYGKIFTGKSNKIVDITEKNYILDDGKAYSIELQDGWKLSEQKPAWSEKDERKLELLRALIDDTKRDSASYSTMFREMNELDNWLKSLRPQNRWKPSEEQLNAFEHFVRSIGESGYASPYDDNTKLLYSLLNDLKNL